MSLLSIARNVLARAGWPLPGTVATNAEGTAQQVMALAQLALRTVAEEFPWPQLEVEYQFSTVPGQTVYFWPADFGTLAPSSLYDAGQYFDMKGSMTPSEWNERRYGALANILPRGYRVVYVLGAPAIELDSEPTTAEPLVGTYKTCQYVRTAQGVGATTYMNDDDVAKVPEAYVEASLEWRFRRAKGLDFSVELAEYNATVKAQFAATNNLGEIPVGGTRLNNPLTGGYVRDRGFGA